MELCEATDKWDEAAKWRTELDAQGGAEEDGDAAMTESAVAQGDLGTPFAGS